MVKPTKSEDRKMREICITLLLLFCMPVFAECDVCCIAFDIGDQVTVDEKTTPPMATAPERIPIGAGSGDTTIKDRATIPTADTGYDDVTAYVSTPYEVGWRS